MAKHRAPDKRLQLAICQQLIQVVVVRDAATMQRLVQLPFTVVCCHDNGDAVVQGDVIFLNFRLEAELDA